jgi:Glycosyl hydrolase family 12
MKKWSMRRISILTVLGLTAAVAVNLGGVAYAATCTTSAQYGECSYSPYVLANNMWGEVSGSTQTLSASSYNDWSITGSEPNSGGVKTYPENDENYSGTPVDLINTIDQNFALTAVPACNSSSKWEIASDDWLNATAGEPGAVEVMVWEDNCHQIPAGSNTGDTTTFNGQTFDLWAKTGTNPTYTLVSTTNVTSGLVHMADTFNWLGSLGYISGNDGLEQLNMGIEIVSTNAAKLTWTFDKSNNNVVYDGG